MSDAPLLSIRAAGLLSLEVEWRPANDFDLAGLRCWHALHPEAREQPLFMATFPTMRHDPQSSHHPQAVQRLQHLGAASDAGCALLYLHTGLATDCKSALLPNLVWQSGPFSEVLGMKIHHDAIGWAELELAATMAQQNGSCLLVLDSLPRFTTHPERETCQLAYLQIAASAAGGAGGWFWHAVPASGTAPQSLTAWLRAPGEGEIAIARGDAALTVTATRCRYRAGHAA